MKLNHIKKQIEAFGYQEGDRVCLRAFRHKDHPEYSKNDGGRNAEFIYPDINEKLLEQWASEGRSTYIIVNPGGHCDADITCGRVLFYEHDDVDKEYSKGLWKSLGLPEPTVQIDSGNKSIQTFWTLTEPVTPSEFRQLQIGLIAIAKADPVNKNPSRVMRLAGCINAKTGNYALIVAGTGKPVSVDEIKAALPKVVDTGSNISYTEFSQSFSFPIEDAVPLRECLSRTNRQKLNDGSEDYRNKGAFNLACDLIAIADFLDHEGQRYTEEPYELFIEFCEKCPPGEGWNHQEWDVTWSSAEKKPRQPALPLDAVITKIKEWSWKNCPHKDVLNISGIVKDFSNKHEKVKIDPIPEDADDEEKTIIAIANYIKLRDSGNNFQFFPYRQKLLDGSITGHRITLSDVELLARDLERQQISELTATSDFLGDVYAETELRANSDEIPGFSCGFKEVDDATDGWQRSDLIIVAARPGMGKSTFILNVARNIAAISKQPVGFFSLEMSKIQLGYKLLANESNIDSRRLRVGKIATPEWEKLGHGIMRLSQIPLYVDDTPYITISELIAKTKKLYKEKGLSALVIDYLQLMVEGDNLNLEVGKITKKLKALARELNIPIFLLSQLNRGVESRTNKRPANSDLRDSGNIEQDADVVVMIYREEYYDSVTPDRGLAELIFTKHRNGPTGVVKLQVELETSKFKSLESASFTQMEDF
jgi:hypothetical protein